MFDRDYFTVESTACTIPKRGAQAIVCGDKPRKNKDGKTSYSLRAPLLIMPPEMWSDPDETMQRIVRVLNENAALFFDSAKDRQAEHDRRVLAGEI
ncbi:hypothetical protein [Pseudogemmobacter humi]|uniref:Uncharacterized protein n=1 Tax=Pseudogemmobacter humi TaxID=2483812 RepID=A0A3P5XIA3_9RHOB|nr:hypothetical protein [Pseudogemmobacter humi]VDC28258.1 hypothetical protein XINFAN_02033 [Pseudogemmobacter humi]